MVAVMRAAIAARARSSSLRGTSRIREESRAGQGLTQAERDQTSKMASSTAAGVNMDDGLRLRLAFALSEVFASAFEHRRTQQFVCRQRAVLNLSLDDRLDPRGLRLLHRHRQRRCLADVRIEQLAELVQGFVSKSGLRLPA